MRFQDNRWWRSETGGGRVVVFSSTHQRVQKIKFARYGDVHPSAHVTGISQHVAGVQLYRCRTLLHCGHEAAQHASAARGHDVACAALEQIGGGLQGANTPADERGEVGDVAGEAGEDGLSIGEDDGCVEGVTCCSAALTMSKRLRESVRRGCGILGALRTRRCDGSKTKTHCNACESKM